MPEVTAGHIQDMDFYLLLKAHEAVGGRVGISHGHGTCKEIIELVRSNRFRNSSMEHPSREVEHVEHLACLCFKWIFLALSVALLFTWFSWVFLQIWVGHFT